MRSLRYRIVTLCAVMLALAAGILLGSGPLQGDEAVTNVSGDEGDDAAQEAQRRIEQQQAALDFADSYAQATGQGLVADALGGRAVVVVTLPGADEDDVARVVSTVGDAGGTVVSQVALREKLLDVAQRQLVSELARQMDVGATKKAVRIPASAGDYGGMSRMLAYALLTDDKGGDQGDRVAEGIMAGLTTAGLVDVADPGDTGTPRRGSAVVVVGGAPYGSADEREGAGSILDEVLVAFDRAGDGTVLAAPVSASAPDGLVAAVREGAAAKVASTVDVVDQAAGAVVTVLALAADLAGTTGDYGSEAAADGPLPDQAANGAGHGAGPAHHQDTGGAQGGTKGAGNGGTKGGKKGGGEGGKRGGGRG